MDTQAIIEKYYTKGTKLYNIYMSHVTDVTNKHYQLHTNILNWQ